MRAAGNAIDARAGAMLLARGRRRRRRRARRQAERVGEGLRRDSGALEVLVAQDASQRDRLWSARREMTYAVRKLARRKLSEDVVVPRQRIGELLERVSEIGARHRDSPR